MKKYLPFLIVFTILACDQALKIWIKLNMYLGEELHVFDNWFILHFTENNGIAFGLELTGTAGKLLLSLFRIGAATAIGYYLFLLIKKNAKTGLIISLSFVLAGAIGNILDSVFYGILFSESTFYTTAHFLPEGGGYAPFLFGKVVDMLYFPVWSSSYPDWIPIVGGERFLFFRPVFNISDSSITIGVISILLFHRDIFKSN